MITIYASSHNFPTSGICNKGRFRRLIVLPFYLFRFLFVLQHCDGVDIAFPFGKRDINVRNVNAKCCDTDLCNYPAPTPISVTGILK